MCLCVCPPFIWFGRLIRAKSNFLLRLALPPLVKPAPAFVTASYKKTHTHTATSAFCISLLIKEKQNHVTETDKHITSHGRKRKKNNKLFSAVDFFRLDQTKKKRKDSLWRKDCKSILRYFLSHTGSTRDRESRLMI